MSPALQADSLPLNYLGSPVIQTEKNKYCKLSLLSRIKKERKGKRKKIINTENRLVFARDVEREVDEMG